MGLLRRISAGFTSGLSGPRSRDKKTIHQNLRLALYPVLKNEGHGASGKVRSALVRAHRRLNLRLINVEVSVDVLHVVVLFERLY